MSGIMHTREGGRLLEGRNGHAWRRWGPYPSDRQWGTVREDYSADGEAWTNLPHDHARSRAYRWGEDALAGFGEEKLRWCLGLALWNGHDPILKERLFGLTNAEGNHGEDVKELYYHLEATPTHSYMKMLYKYPHAAFPYDALVAENRRRGQDAPEYELLDTGLFDQSRYFDVFVEYAKASPDDVLMRVRINNRGDQPARLWVLPQLWARNVWSWSDDVPRPLLEAQGAREVRVAHRRLDEMRWFAESSDALLFCDNDTNVRRLYGESRDGFFKDGINDFVVGGHEAAVNPARRGTKCAALHAIEVPGGGEHVIRLRLRLASETTPPFEDFDGVFAARIAEADEFYAALQADCVGDERRLVQRRALAGMIWSKQFYHYDVHLWLEGDPSGPKRPHTQRRLGACARRRHHVDAGQMGISLVRIVGPGSAMSGAGAGGSGFRQRADPAADPGMAHPSQRGAACL